MKSQLFSLSLLLSSSLLSAQDTRNATEPKSPPACATLDAQLTGVGRTLAPGDEKKLDTARIQAAIDRCGKGRAVVLRKGAEGDALLSGPLEMLAGVTLLVDSRRSDAA